MSASALGLLRAAIPISAARLGLALMIPVGLSFMGSAGIAQQAAFGLAASINNWFLVVGPAVLLSGFFKGAEMTQKGGQLSRQLLASVLSLCAIVACASLALTLAIAAALPHVYPDQGALARTAGQALVIQAFGNIFYFYLTGIMLLLEGMGRSGVTALVIFGGVLANLAATHFLVRWGAGLADPAVLAAWGSFAGRAVAGVAVLYYLSRHVLALRARDLIFGGHWNTVRELLRTGASSGAGKVAEAAAFTGLGLLAALGGGAVVAGYSIFYFFASVMYMSLIGVTNVTARTFGGAGGVRTREGMRTLAQALVLFGAAYAMLAGVALWQPQWLWAGFRPAPELLRQLASLAQPALFATMTFALVFLASQVCRALGLHGTTTRCLLVSYPVAMLALSAWSSVQFDLGLAGIVWSFATANCFALAWLVSRFMGVPCRPQRLAPA